MIHRTHSITVTMTMSDRRKKALEEEERRVKVKKKAIFEAQLVCSANQHRIQAERARKIEEKKRLAEERMRKAEEKRKALEKKEREKNLLKLEKSNVRSRPQVRNQERPIIRSKSMGSKVISTAATTSFAGSIGSNAGQKLLGFGSSTPRAVCIPLGTPRLRSSGKKPLQGGVLTNSFCHNRLTTEPSFRNHTIGGRTGKLVAQHYKIEFTKDLDRARQRNTSSSESSSFKKNEKMANNLVNGSKSLATRNVTRSASNPSKNYLKTQPAASDKKGGEFQALYHNGFAVELKKKPSQVEVPQPQQDEEAYRLKMLDMRRQARYRREQEVLDEEKT
ncbi:hypothetical protein Ciccas_006764 [Cichlidogyrus casuarinus]|uniref:Uncharacterized protein n=1 Tax=Cichlidogyrus casuarinus TaxID=1844966 RepID=A0ABD2Q515_9PLAT